MNSPAANDAGAPRCGVMLVNLGTPAAPTRPAIRRYLAQFLSDPRVIELPRAVWLPLLYGLILPRRPRRLVPAYRKIWGPEGSPLLVISRKQTQGLAELLAQRFDTPPAVALAMSYGEPSIAAAWRALQDQHIGRLLVLPLFPQYSGATVGAVMEAVFDALRGSRDLPAVRTVHDYHDDPGYIDALATQVREHWNRRGRGRHLLMSFHGLPRRYVDKGDPYHAQCLETSRLLARALGLADTEWSIGFQSRFGRAPWLQPYTDACLIRLARSGTGVDVVCPGFAADCLETLEEVDIRYRALFAAHHGQGFECVPALNAGDAHLTALAGIVTRELQGWATTVAPSAAGEARPARPRHGW